MEYRRLIKHVKPKMCKQWMRSFANEPENLAQVIREQVKGETPFSLSNRKKLQRIRRK